MKLHKTNFVSLVAILACCLMCLITLRVNGQANNGERVDQQARQEILDSQRWADAKQQLDSWLSVQKVYSDEEVEVLKSELRNRIAVMSPQELQAFLEEMEAKVAVLMSPASLDARRWASKYTDKALERYRKKFGVEDPARMSAADLETALAEFTAQRQSKLESSAAFRQSRQSQARAAKNYNQAQAKAARRPSVAGRYRAPSSSSPYSPRRASSRVKTYSAPYPKLNYSVGPWGGVWVSPRK